MRGKLCAAGAEIKSWDQLRAPAVLADDDSIRLRFALGSRAMDDGGTGGGARPRVAARKARLGAALRENLQRRKAQARGRGSAAESGRDPADDRTPTGAEPDGGEDR